MENDEKEKRKSRIVKSLYTKAEYSLMLKETQKMLQITRALIKRKSTSDTERIALEASLKDIEKNRDTLKKEYLNSQVTYLKRGIDEFKNDLNDTAVKNIVTDFSTFEKKLSLRDILGIPDKKKLD